MVITGPADLAAALERFGGRMWLRAVTGAAGRGSLPVEDLDTARGWLDLQHGWGGDFTAAELLEPDSVTWMSLWHEGELIVAQSRRRLYWELGRLAPSGVTGITGAGETIRDGVLDAIALRAVQAIDPEPHGLFGVDLALDRDGVPNPTEINIGRFFTTHLFFSQLGLNMPELYVRLGFGEDVAPIEPRLNPLPPGMVWIRGVDFEPVLVAAEEIEAHAGGLARRLDPVSA
jgi:carbamoyl-phosphate synthase large subunit